MTARILVTGGTGYLGSAVVKELLARERKVRLLVRDPSRILPEHRGLTEVAEGDLLDLDSVRAACRDVKSVCHVAGLAADWVADERAFERANVEATQNVLVAARAEGVSRVVATSTVMTYGPSDGLAEANETTARSSRPYDLIYQTTKARARVLCKRARRDGQDVVLVSPGALYGPGPLTEGNYLVRVMESLASGAYPALPITTGRRWCLAHVQDVARGHVQALDRATSHEDYILGGENVAFDRMLELMRDGLALARLPMRVPGSLLVLGVRILSSWHALFGSRPPISVGGAKALNLDWAFSSNRALRVLDYSISPFESSFSEFVRWYAKERSASRGLVLR